MMLKVFDVVSTIYDKYKPKGRKSFFKLPLRFETNINNEGHESICQVHTKAEDPLETEGTRTTLVSNN